MTSQPGQRRITIKILQNISESKANNATKFGRVIFLFKNHAENEAERLVPDLFLFFKKAL